MRLKLGRPDIARYSDRFNVPAAQPDTPLSVTWLGVATLLLDDGSSALMTDGFFSRPGLTQLAAASWRRRRRAWTAAWPGPRCRGLRRSSRCTPTSTT